MSDRRISRRVTKAAVLPEGDRSHHLYVLLECGHMHYLPHLHTAPKVLRCLFCEIVWDLLTAPKHTGRGRPRVGRGMARNVDFSLSTIKPDILIELRAESMITKPDLKQGFGAPGISF